MSIEESSLILVMLAVPACLALPKKAMLCADALEKRMDGTARASRGRRSYYPKP